MCRIFSIIFMLLFSIGYSETTKPLNTNILELEQKALDSDASLSEDNTLQEEQKPLQMHEETLTNDDSSTDSLINEVISENKKNESLGISKTSHSDEKAIVFFHKKEKKEHKPKSKSTCSKVKKDPCEKNYFIEFKPAYFHYQDRVARSIFGSGGYMSIFGFDAKAYKELHAWIDVGFLFDSGRVKAVNSKEKLTLVPVSAGLKYLKKITDRASLYAKFGPNWTYISTKTDYPYVQSKVNKNNFGFLAGVGSLVYISNNFSFDFFFDYIYNKKSFTDSNSNLKIKAYFGGFAIGAGIGYGF